MALASFGALPVELRTYQIDLEEQIRQRIRDGYRRILLQLWMGGGKTVVASDILAKAAGKHRSAIFLAPRRELVWQASDKLDRFGVPHGIIMAGEEPLARFTQVASVQTLHSRVCRRATMEIPPADLVFVDECHRSLARSYQQIMEHWPDSVFIGLTATPARGDGRGLGAFYDTMVQGPSIRDMLDAGWLVRPRVFAPSEPDLEGIRVRAGDYVEHELETRMDQPQLVGDVVSHWKRFASDRKTVVFATGVNHGVHIRDEFLAAGIPAEILTGETEHQERDQIIRRLRDGELSVVVNVMVLTEGWDCPEASCCILARPTRSLVLYLQMVGRILRPAGGKTDALVLDHSGAVYRHGFIEEFQDWTLDPDSRNINPTQERRESAGARPHTCPECFFVFTGSPQCPNCGEPLRRNGQAVAYIDGELGEVRADRTPPKKRETPTAEKQLWYRMFLWHGAQKGYKPGWAAYAFKRKFGHWPPSDWQFMDGAPPNDEAKRYIKHLQVRAAKSPNRGHQSGS